MPRAIPKVVFALTALGLTISCDHPTAPSSPVVDVATPGSTPTFAPVVGGAVHSTPSIESSCGTDGFMREPVALADLDGGGSLERVSVTREASTLTIGVHRLPRFEKAGEWKIPGDWAEVGALSCGPDKPGSLWVSVSRALDPKGNKWVKQLFHLDKGQLTMTRDAIESADLWFDLDGDGCPDPIVTDAWGTTVFHGGKWEPVPRKLGPLRLVGQKRDDGVFVGVDLDGDGRRDFLQIADGSLSIVDATTFATSWTIKGKVWDADIVDWGGKRYIAANLDQKMKLIGTDAKHTELLSLTSESYHGFEPSIDVGGDHSILALHTLRDAMLAPGDTTPVELDFKLATPVEGGGRTVKPSPLSIGGPKEIVGVKIVDMGSPMIAFPGSDASYELVAFDGGPRSAKKPRVITTTKLTGSLGASASMIDLERDGVSEILVDESTSYSSCDMKGGGGSSRVYLVDGHGKELWSDTKRSWIQGEAATRNVSARVRAIDLWGDGRRALHVRAGTQEFYVLGRGVEPPSTLPPCLE